MSIPYFLDQSGFEADQLAESWSASKTDLCTRSVFFLHKEGNGKQNLNLYVRDPQEMFLKLFRDPAAAGKQYFKSELYQNDNGDLEFNHANGALWWQGAHLNSC